MVIKKKNYAEFFDGAILRTQEDLIYLEFLRVKLQNQIFSVF